MPNYRTARSHWPGRQATIERRAVDAHRETDKDSPDEPNAPLP
jgi:hypothetical protein